MPGNTGRGLKPPSIHGGSLLDFFETFEQIRKDGSYSFTEIESRDEQLLQSLVQACGRRPAVTRLLKVWGISQMTPALRALSKYKKLDAFLLSFWLKRSGRSISVTSLQPFVLRSIQPDIQNQYDKIVKQLPRMKLGAQFSYDARCRIVNIFFTMFAFSGTLQGFCARLFLTGNEKQLDFRHVLDSWALVLANDLGSIDSHSEKTSSFEFMRFAWDTVCEEVTDQVERLYKQVLQKRRPGLRKPPLLKFHEYVSHSELENIVPVICMRVVFKTAFWQLVFWQKRRGGSLKHSEYEAFSNMAERSFEKLLAEAGYVRSLPCAPVALEERNENCVSFNKEAFLKMLADAGTADFHLSYQSHVLKRAIQFPLRICSKKTIREEVDKRVSSEQPRENLTSAEAQDETVCHVVTNNGFQGQVNNVCEEADKRVSSERPQKILKSSEPQDGTVCHVETNNGPQGQVNNVYEEADERVSSERPRKRLKSSELQDATVCHVETNNGPQGQVKNICEEADERVSSERPRKRLKSSEPQDAMVSRIETKNNLQEQLNIYGEADGRVSSKRPQKRLKSAETHDGTVCPVEIKNSPQRQVTNVESPVPSLSEIQPSNCTEEQTHAESGWRQFVQLFVRAVQNYFGLGRNERTA
ncbi:hypothetical protein FGB62_6g316 [Gracilaria domingensis]|nr:hypothetical protein FGB62_6g316 [Gracilaria domingensis]